MLEILKKHKATGPSGPLFLQETRWRLYANGKIVAEGREDWIGSIEWRRDLIQAPAIAKTRLANHPGNGKRRVNCCTCWRTFPIARSSSRAASASAMRSATSSISSSFIPRVVTAGVPRRIPPGLKIG